MILSLLKLSRPYYSLPFAAGFVVIMFYLTGGDINPVLTKTVLAFLSLAFIISAGYILNDVCDIEVDIINSPTRTLAKGSLSKNSALAWSIICFASGLALAGCCSWAFLLGISAITGLLVFYNIYSKRIGIYKDIIIAVLLTSLYPLSLTVARPVQSPRLIVLLIHPVWLFLSAAGYEMLKDIHDIKGDRQIHGLGNKYCENRKFITLARALIVTGSIITLLPYFLGACRYIYLAASIISISLAILSSRYKPAQAVRYVYVSIFLITTGAMVDLLILGP